MKRHEIPPVQPPVEPWNEKSAPPVQPPVEPWMTQEDTRYQFLAPW